VRLFCATREEGRPPTPAETLTLTKIVIQFKANEEAVARK
jgi:hypothetical protein